MSDPYLLVFLEKSRAQTLFRFAHETRLRSVREVAADDVAASRGARDGREVVKMFSFGIPE